MNRLNQKSRVVTLATVILIAAATLAWWLLSSTATDDRAFDDNNIQFAGPFKAVIHLDPEQPKVGDNTLTIILRDKDNQPVTDARINAVAEMPAMGSMPAMPAPATMEYIGSGRYVGTFELSMIGAWPLSLDISSGKTGNARLEFDLTTSRAGVRLRSATPSKVPRTPATFNANSDAEGTKALRHRALDLISAPKKKMLPGSIRIDARRRQLIGVTTGIAEEKRLIQTISAAGHVAYDETRLTDISLKFSGWIGKLHANFRGVAVTKGRPLFSVYSPELLSAQQEYLEIRRRRKGKQSTLLKAARQRLALWDINPAQISQLEQRGTPIEYLPIMSPVSGIVIDKMIVAGSAVKAGQKLLRIANLSRVWVEGEIYEHEIPLVRVGMDAIIVLPELSGKTLLGKVAYIAPYLQGDTRTAKVRVELDNRERLLKPDMYTQLHLNIDLGKRLVVPEAAVLYAGKSRVVFIDLGNGQLQPRKIKTGLRNADDIEVLEGLSPGDKVVTSGNFLIAAESKLKAGVEQW